MWSVLPMSSSEPAMPRLSAAERNSSRPRSRYSSASLRSPLRRLRRAAIARGGLASVAGECEVAADLFLRGGRAALRVQLEPARDDGVIAAALGLVDALVDELPQVRIDEAKLALARHAGLLRF